MQTYQAQPYTISNPMLEAESCRIACYTYHKQYMLNCAHSLTNKHGTLVDGSQSHILELIEEVIKACHEAGVDYSVTNSIAFTTASPASPQAADDVTIDTLARLYGMEWGSNIHISAWNDWLIATAKCNIPGSDLYIVRDVAFMQAIMSEDADCFRYIPKAHHALLLESKWVIFPMMGPQYQEGSAHFSVCVLHNSHVHNFTVPFLYHLDSGVAAGFNHDTERICDKMWAALERLFAAQPSTSDTSAPAINPFTSNNK
jgi:hypothetical protein